MTEIHAEDNYVQIRAHCYLSFDLNVGDVGLHQEGSKTFIEVPGFSHWLELKPELLRPDESTLTLQVGGLFLEIRLHEGDHERLLAKLKPLPPA